MATEVGRGIVPIEADASGLAKDIDEKVKAQHGDIGKVFGDLGKVAGAALVGAAGLAVAAGAGLAKLGESFDEAYDHIRVTTGKTGQALADLQDDFKAVATAVPVDFGQASTAVASLNQKLGLSGKPLQAVSEQMLNLSRITKTDLQTNINAVAGTFNQWGVTADQQGTKLDELYNVSQKTGVSFAALSDSLAQGGAQFRAAGLTFEQSSALVGLLAKNGLDAGAVIPALGKAMATAAKDGKPTAEVFKATFDSIRNAPNDTAGAQAAIDTFGAKAGPKFAALIREGKLSYDDFAASIASGGDTINGAAQQTDDWREKLKLLINKVFVILEPIATKVFGAIGTAIDKLTPYFQAIAAWFSEHLPGAIKVVEQWINEHLVPVFRAVADWVVDHWPQISAVAIAVFDAIRDAIAYFVTEIVPKILGALKATFGWLMDHKEVLIGVAVGVGAALVALFASWAAGAAAAAAATLAAAAPFIAVGAAIAALVAGILYAYNHVQWFHDAVDAVGRFLRDVLWPALQDVFGWLRDNVPPILQGIADVFKAVFNWVNDNVVPIIKAIVDFIANDFVPAVQAAFGWIKDNVVPIFTAIANFISDRVVPVVSGLASFLIGAFTGAVQAVITIFGALRDAGQWVVDKVQMIWDHTEGLRAFLVAPLVLAIGAAKLAFEGIRDAIGWVWDKVDALWTKSEGLRSFLAGVFSIGVEAAKTAFNGVKDAIGFVVDKVQALWDKTSGLRDFLADAFGTALGALVTTFGAVRDAVGWVFDKLGKLWDKLDDVLGIASKVVTAIGNIFGGDISVTVTGPIKQPGKPPGKNAAGTRNWPGGLSWVGERGPELLNLPAGTDVYDDVTSQRMVDNMQLASAAVVGGGGGTFNYSPTYQFPADHHIGKMVGDAVQQFIRFNGRVPWSTPGNPAFS